MQTSPLPPPPFLASLRIVMKGKKDKILYHKCTEPKIHGRRVQIAKGI